MEEDNGVLLDGAKKSSNEEERQKKLQELQVGLLQYKHRITISTITKTSGLVSYPMRKAIAL